MSNLLIKLFVKNYKDVENSKVRKSYGLLASIFGIISNIIVCLLKLVLGVIFNLMSLIADGMNNLTDAGSSCVSLFGFVLSSKPSDKDHPFGHARIEYIAGLIVSIIIVFVGGQLVITSIQDIIASFQNPFEPIDDLFFYVTLIALVISILIKLYQGYFYRKLGRTISSTSLIATGVDSRNDVIATSVVLLGLVFSKVFSFYIDGYLSLAVGIFILISGIKLIFETANPLIGEKPDNSLIDRFISYLKQSPKILGYHDLQIHSYGPGVYFATCHVEVDSKENILEIHDLIDNIEKQIQKEMNIITTLHMDPIVIGDPLTDKIKEEVKTSLSDLPYILNIHDFRIVKGPTHINIVFDVIVSQDKALNLEEISKDIDSRIHALSENYHPVVTIDYDYTSYLSD